VSIEPDTKDWTWVIDKACPDCGWDPEEVDREQFADKLHETTKGWYDMLADADYAVRPAPHVWSRLEYACHVRDVHRIFAERVKRMLVEDDPTFDNWDQDATAEEEDYGLQEAASVGVDLVERAAEAAAIYASVEGDQWQRKGRRRAKDGARDAAGDDTADAAGGSEGGAGEDAGDDAEGAGAGADEGAEFTVETIGRYHLHDVIHHLWDISITPAPPAPDA